MPLFSNPLSAAQSAASQLLTIANNQFAQLQTAGLRGYNLLWSNPGASPAAILAALGTNAQLVYELALLNAETIVQAAQLAGQPPPALPSIPAGYQLTFGSDGQAVLVQNAGTNE